jgi:hypothetical protein
MKFTIIVTKFQAIITTNCRLSTRSMGASHVVGHNRANIVFVSVYHIYSVSTDGVSVWLYEV